MIIEWTWPPWLLGYCIAMDQNGRWHAYSNKPECSYKSWQGGGSFLWLDPKLINIPFPVCKNWKKSMILNPNNETVQCG